VVEIPSQKGDNLYFQVGTHKTDKYKELKPAVAIVGPGLTKKQSSVSNSTWYGSSSI